MGLNELNQFADSLAEQDERKTAVSASMRDAFGSNPDEQAKLQKLSGRTSVPAKWLAEDQNARQDAERRAFLEDNDPQGLAERSPKTAQWLSSPDNAKLAHDDIGAFEKIEDIFKGGSTLGIATQADKEMAVKAKLPFRTLRSGMEQTRAGRLGYQSTYDKSPGVQDEIKRLNKKVSAVDREMEDEGGFVGGFLAPAAQVVGQMIESGKQALFRGAQGAVAGAGAGALAGGVGALPGAGMGFVAGLGAGFAEDVFKTEGGAAYTELKSIKGENGEGINEGTAQTAAVGVGMANALLEMVGLKIASAPIKKAVQAGIKKSAETGVKKALVKPTIKGAAATFGKDYFTTVGGETATEIMQEAVNIAAEEMSRAASDGKFDETTAEEIGSRLFAIADKTARAMLVLGVPGAGANFGANVSKANKAQQQADMLTSLGESVNESKTFQRLPGKLQEFIRDIKKDGPVESVYIPAEAWTTLWQSANVDPDLVAGEILSDTTGYQEALASGHDISIPIDDFIRLAGTDKYGEITKNVRFRPGDMTLAESEEFKANQEQTVNDLLSSIEDTASQDAVYQDVLGQLLGTGMERTAAERQAQLWQSVFNSLGERSGIDPAELYQQNAPKIVRPLPDVLAQRLTVDTALDPYLDTLRAGKEGPTEADMFGPSLIDFLAAQGGLKDSGGELKAMDAGRLSRKNGIELDRAREVAAEAGYLPMESTTADLLDLIGSGLRGNQTYAPGNANDAAINERATFDQLKQYLDQQGFDLAQASNEDVRRVMGQGVLYQSAWHGSPYTFDKFTTSAIGTGEGAQAYGYGLYFAGAREVAEFYKKTLAENDIRIDGKRSFEWTVSDDVKRLIIKYNGNIDNALDEAAEVAKSEYLSIRSMGKKSLGELTELKESGRVTVNKGKLYKVELAPKEDEYLLWDKPLAQQSEKVQRGIIKAIKGIEEEQRILDNKDSAAGAFIYNKIWQHKIINDRKVEPAEVKHKQTSDLLHKYGVRGIKYLDGSTRNNTSWLAKHPQGGINDFADEASAKKFIEKNPEYELIPPKQNFNYVIFSDDDVEITEVFQKDKDTKRAFFDLSTKTIGLLQNADLSSFLHESAHFYFEVLADLAGKADAPQQIKDDFQSLLSWFGVESRELMTVEHYEQFARGFEAYLGEGKAPSAEMRGIFQRFKAWMKQVYSDLKKLNVELSDEVRGVFDRLVATDEQITRAREMQQYAPIFTTAQEAGMSETEFTVYRKEAEEAHAAQIERLEREALKEFTREQKKWWKEERSKLRAEVEAEAKQNPVYEAINFLSKGTFFDGSTPEMGAVKLSKGELVRLYGEEFIKRLPRGFGYLYAKENGVHPDFVAEIFGFESGDELIRKMIEAPKMSYWVEAETAVRMREKYGDMLTDGTLAEKAMKAVHEGDNQGRVMRAELAAIRRKEREVRPYVKAAEKDVQNELEKEREYERRWLEAEKNLAVEMAKGVAAEKIAAIKKEIADNKRLQRQARMEMRASIPPLDAFRLAATQAISAKKVEDIRPGVYLAAEQKAARQAFDAAAKGDFETAGKAKTQQLMNHYLYREAVAAKEDAEKIYQYAVKSQKTPAQKRLAEAGGDFLEQFNALLSRYEFQRVTITELKTRKSLLEWAADLEAEGYTVPIPDDVMERIVRVNYKELTIEELRGVYDALKAIDHLAREYRGFRKDNDLLNFEDVKDELIMSVQESKLISKGELGTPNKRNLSLKEKGARAWRKFDAAHLKIEQIIEWLDGGKIDGPWARYFFDLADKAQTKEYDLHTKVTKRLNEIAEEQTSEWRQSLMDKTGARLAGINGNLDRYTLISIAMNVGNEGNRQRLLDGYGWTDEDLDMALSELTEADWNYVQSIWDEVNSLWPEIVALQKRVSGIPPKKIDPLPVATAFGEYAGGYFPLVYDPRTSNAGEKQADATESVQDFMARGYGMGSTPKGHTKERLENVQATVLLDYEQVLSSHMAKVIKDISHREAVIGINKVLKNGAIKNVLMDKLGEDIYKEMRNWMQVLISDRSDSLHQNLGLAGTIMRGLRINTAVVTMGWKISTFMTQFAGLGPSMDLVRPRHLSKALIQLVRNPKKTFDFIMEKSGEMRHRSNTLDRDLKDALLKIRGDRSKVASIQRSAFYLTGIADRMVSLPTWLGGYNQALSEGLAESDAIRAGDRAVRLSQGSGGAKDLAAIQRQNDLTKLLTMYYTPFSVLYARLRDMGVNTKGVKDLPRLVARSIGLIIIPAVISELLAARGPDDDEDPTWWATRKTLLYPFQSVPVLRDIVNHLDSKGAFGGGGRYRPSYKLSPVESSIEKIMRASENLKDSWDGSDPWDDTAWDALEAVGYVWPGGLPTAQVRITGEYLEDLLTGSGNTDNPTGLLFRRPRQ